MRNLKKVKFIRLESQFYLNKLEKIKQKQLLFHEFVLWAGLGAAVCSSPVGYRQGGPKEADGSTSEIAYSYRKQTVDSCQ